MPDPVGEDNESQGEEAVERKLVAERGDVPHHFSLGNGEVGHGGVSDAKRIPNELRGFVSEGASNRTALNENGVNVLNPFDSSFTALLRSSLKLL